MPQPVEKKIKFSKGKVPPKIIPKITHKEKHNITDEEFNDIMVTYSSLILFNFNG